MKLRVGLLLSILLLNVFFARAQFEGLGSFQWDQALREQVKKQRVRSVTAMSARSTYTAYEGRYTFDTLGRVIEIHGSGGHRSGMEYNEKGLIVKNIHYEDKDTSKIAYSINREFDQKGKLIKEESAGYDSTGKLITTKVRETKSVKEPNGTTRREIYEYYQDQVRDTLFARDSTAGDFDFEIVYEYDRDEVDEKGRRRGKKTLTREYYKDKEYYSDEVKYIVYGRIEMAEKIESRYQIWDAKGRELESGEIDYEQAFEKYFSEHPQDFNMYTLPAPFIKGILKGEIKGEKKPNVKCTYDAKGLLVEKKHYGSTYKFKYNAKGQMVEQTSTMDYSNSPSTSFFYYNEKGLVSKLVSMHPHPYDPSAPPEKTEYTFTFTYY